MDEKKSPARVGDRGNLLKAYFYCCGLSVDEKKAHAEEGGLTKNETINDKDFWWIPASRG